MLAAGIPAIRSAVEDQYYTLELCLTPTQLPIFLAQLSGREDVADSHLQSLVGAVDGNRRESFMPTRTSAPSCSRHVWASSLLSSTTTQASQDTAERHER